MMEGLLANIVEISLLMSCLIGGIFFFSPLLNQKYRQKWTYWAWLIIAVRLIIPFNIEMPQQLIELPSLNRQIIAENLGTDEKQALSWQNQENRASEAFSQKSEQGKFPFKFSLYQLLALVWLLGAVIFLLWQIIGYYIFSTRMKKMSIPVDNPQIRDIFQYQMGKINISKKIDLMFSFQAGSPMLMGFFSPTLFLPQRNYSGEELEFIFCHELIHCQRGDIFYKLLLLMANACHWFNPLIYLMVKRAAKDLELTCDARVISLMEKEKGSNSALQIRKGYSSAIINAVQLEMQAVTGLSTYFYGGKEAMKERISNIFDMRKKKKGYLLLAGLLLLACFSGVLVACEDQVPPKIDQSFLEQLLDGGFLRMEIGHNLPDYKLDKLDNGENHYIWSLWNKQDQSFIHDVQMMELDGNLTFYHYKDYSFQFEPLPQPLTIKEAGKLVEKFSGTFLPQGKKLVWKNEPAYYSLYDPGHVESWVAVRDDRKYVAMVDLDAGNLLFFNIFDEALLAMPASDVLDNRDYDAYASLKTPYLGDNVATSKVLSISPLAPYAQNGFSMKTDKRPYELAIDFKIDEWGKYKNKELNAMVYITALDTFALIDNLDVLTIAVDGYLADGSGFSSAWVVDRGTLEKDWQVKTADLAANPQLWFATAQNIMNWFKDK